MLKMKTSRLRIKRSRDTTQIDLEGAIAILAFSLLALGCLGYLLLR